MVKKRSPECVHWGSRRGTAPGRVSSGFEARVGPEPDPSRIPNRIPDPPQIHPRSIPDSDPDPGPGPDPIFEFFDENVKKTKFCQMIEYAIANSSIAGRPPNSDFLIGFWSVENLPFFP